MSSVETKKAERKVSDDGDYKHDDSKQEGCRTMAVKLDFGDKCVDDTVQPKTNWVSQAWWDRNNAAGTGLQLWFSYAAFTSQLCLNDISCEYTASNGSSRTYTFDATNISLNNSQEFSQSGLFSITVKFYQSSNKYYYSICWALGSITKTFYYGPLTMSTTNTDILNDCLLNYNGYHLSELDQKNEAFDEKDENDKKTNVKTTKDDQLTENGKITGVKLSLPNGSPQDTLPPPPLLGGVKNKTVWTYYRYSYGYRGSGSANSRLNNPGIRMTFYYTVSKNEFCFKNLQFIYYVNNGSKSTTINPNPNSGDIAIDTTGPSTAWSIGNPAFKIQIKYQLQSGTYKYQFYHGYNGSAMTPGISHVVTPQSTTADICDVLQNDINKPFLHSKGFHLSTIYGGNKNNNNNNNNNKSQAFVQNLYSMGNAFDLKEHKHQRYPLTIKFDYDFGNEKEKKIILTNIKLIYHDKIYNCHRNELIIDLNKECIPLKGNFKDDKKRKPFELSFLVGIKYLQDKENNKPILRFSGCFNNTNLIVVYSHPLQ